MMYKKRQHYFSCIIFCILFSNPGLVAQDNRFGTAFDSNDQPPFSVQISEASLIHFGDLIEIDVLGSSEFDWRGTISPEGHLEGFIYSDKPIYGLCRSEEDVAQEVTSHYRKILRDPEVAVRILDRSNRPISILGGAVKTPQRFQIRRPVLLNELLIISGGLTDKASGEVQIFRPRGLNCQSAIVPEIALTSLKAEARERFIDVRRDNESQFINIKIADLLSGKEFSNPQIFSGDIVTVLESQSIYVIGGVERPTQVALRSQLTLTRAIASVGGLSKDADPTKVLIFRREGSETKIIKANLDKIRSEQEDDLLLQIYDVVDVAHSGKELNRVPPIIEDGDRSNDEKLKMPMRVID